MVRDSVHRAWFAASQFFSVHGQAAQADREALRDRARHIKPGPENSAAVHIQQAHHGPVAIRHAREWGEQAQADLRRRREDQHVRAGQRAVQASLTSRGKKKAR